MSRIHDLSLLERPREKAIRFGIDKLSSFDLLALIIGEGTKSESSLDISYKIITKYCGLSNLKKIDYKELQNFKGIGKAKSLALCAAFELAYRMNIETDCTKNKNLSIHNIVKIYEPLFKNEISEKLVVISYRKIIIAEKVISIGNEEQIVSSYRSILNEVLRNDCRDFYLLHNHPGNISSPSKLDIDFTMNLSSLAKRLKLRLKDHIIISQSGYYSFGENKNFHD